MRVASKRAKRIHAASAEIGIRRETTVTELWASRGDIAATKADFIRFFKRGLHADLLLSELMDMIPSIFGRVDWPEAEAASILAMLKAMTPKDVGIKRDDKGVRFEDPPA